MPSHKKPRVSPKKPDYDHSKDCAKYGTDTPTDDACGRYHCRVIGGVSTTTEQRTVSFNAACSCLDPKCKMEHPDRRVLGRASTSAPAECSRCKHYDLLGKRMEFVGLVRTTLIETAAIVVTVSIWLAVIMSVAALVEVAIPNL